MFIKKNGRWVDESMPVETEYKRCNTVYCSPKAETKQIYKVYLDFDPESEKYFSSIDIMKKHMAESMTNDLDMRNWYDEKIEESDIECSFDDFVKSEIESLIDEGYCDYGYSMEKINVY